MRLHFFRIMKYKSFSLFHWTSNYISSFLILPFVVTLTLSMNKVAEAATFNSQTFVFTDEFVTINPKRTDLPDGFDLVSGSFTLDGTGDTFASPGFVGDIIVTDLRFVVSNGIIDIVFDQQNSFPWDNIPNSNWGFAGDLNTGLIEVIGARSSMVELSLSTYRNQGGLSTNGYAFTGAGAIFECGNTICSAFDNQYEVIGLRVDRNPPTETGRMIARFGPASEVPEPVTILGTLTALSFAGLFKKKLDSAK